MARVHRIFSILSFFLFPSLGFAQLNTALDLEGSWHVASSVGFTPRAGLACCELGGQIYAIGGYDGTGMLDKVEVFNPPSGAWKTPMTTGTFTARRGLCCAAVGGKIYAIGGYDGSKPTNILQVLDTTTNRWTTPATTGTFTPREKLCCSVVGGLIYVMGGVGGPDDTIHYNLLEVFDPVNSAWTTPPTTGTFTARRGLASTVVGGKIYVMGGFNGSSYLNTFEVFDPQTNSWSVPVTSGNFTVRGALTACSIRGQIFAIGGINYTQGAYRYLHTVEVFDTASHSWLTPTTQGALTERELLASTAISDQIFVLGGYDGSFLNTNEVFSEATGSVDVLPAAPNLRIFPNPTTGRVTLTNLPGEQIEVTLTDVRGTAIFAGTSMPTPTLTLDFSTLARASYYLRIHTASTSSVQRVILR